MKKIYINGRFLTQKITGVQRYALEMVKEIDREINYNKNYEFIILVPPNIKQTISFNNIKIKIVGHLKGHLWEQIELPFYSRKGLLLNFCGCAPIIRKNQLLHFMMLLFVQFRNRFLLNLEFGIELCFIY